MSKFRFKWDDFMRVSASNHSRSQIAEQANAALDAHLKTLTRVHGRIVYAAKWTEFGEPNVDTHTALLFDVEEIVKAVCKHNPITVDVSDSAVSVTVNGGPTTLYKRERTFSCLTCGAKVRPVGGWEIVP